MGFQAVSLPPVKNGYFSCTGRAGCEFELDEGEGYICQLVCLLSDGVPCGWSLSFGVAQLKLVAHGWLGLVVEPGSKRSCQHQTQSGRSWGPVGFLSSGDENSLAPLKGLC